MVRKFSIQFPLSNYTSPPSGVVSKNDMGEQSMVEWNFVKRVNTERRNRPWRSPSTPYTARYLFLTPTSVEAKGSAVQADSQMLAPTLKPWNTV